MHTSRLDGKERKLAIVASRFNFLIVKSLIEGAQEEFLRHGGEEKNLGVFLVPGAFEIPFACQKIAQKGGYQGIAALGAIIKGETSHYDVLTSAVFSHLQVVSLQFSLPLTSGIITADTVEQALNRAGLKAGNKGSEAMLALLEMVNFPV